MLDAIFSNLQFPGYYTRINYYYISFCLRIFDASYKFDTQLRSIILVSIKTFERANKIWNCSKPIHRTHRYLRPERRAGNVSCTRVARRIGNSRERETRLKSCLLWPKISLVLWFFTSKQHPCRRSGAAPFLGTFKEPSSHESSGCLICRIQNELSRY